METRSFGGGRPRGGRGKAFVSRDYRMEGRRDGGGGNRSGGSGGGGGAGRYGNSGGGKYFVGVGQCLNISYNEETLITLVFLTIKVNFNAPLYLSL